MPPGVEHNVTAGKTYRASGLITVSMPPGVEHALRDMRSEATKR